MLLEFLLLLKFLCCWQFCWVVGALLFLVPTVHGIPSVAVIPAVAVVSLLVENVVLIGYPISILV
jgi:hypothetical protein